MNTITVDYDATIGESLLITRSNKPPIPPIPPKPLPFDIAMARQVFEGDILKDFDTDGNPHAIITSFINLCFGKGRI